MIANGKGVSPLRDNPRPVSRDWRGVILAIVVVAVGLSPNAG